MSVVTLSAPSEGLDMFLGSQFLYGSQDPAGSNSSTSYSWLTSAGDDVQVNGTGITWQSPGGDPLSGTITSMSIDFDDNSNTDINISGIPNADLVAMTTGNDLLNEVFGGNDTINGTGFDDYLKGVAGADSILGNNGNDTLSGGAGNDTLEGGAGADSLIGGNDNDTLDGIAGSNTLSGGDGNDLLIEGTGTDTMNGGDGNDTLQVSSDFSVADDSWDGGAGDDDWFDVSGVSNSGREIDLFNGRWELTPGSATTETLTGIENVDGGSGSETVRGGNADNTIYGNNGNDTLFGNDGVDFLRGDAGDDSIRGGNDNDTIRGGGGDDYLAGDQGDDEFRYSAGAVYGNDSVFGNLGDDKLMLWTTGTYDFTGVQLSQLEEIEFRANGGNQDKTLQISGDEINDGFGFAGSFLIDSNGTTDSDDRLEIDMFFDSSIDLSNATFEDWDDVSDGGGDLIVVNGDGSSESLIGSVQSDSIDGNLGDDVIEGELGDDTLEGGGGTDTLSYAYAQPGGGFALAEFFNINLLTGTTTRTNSLSTLIETDTFAGFENVSGSGFGDIITASGVVNVMNGFNGNDRFITGTGYSGDTYNGGNGTDTIESILGWADSVVFDMLNGEVLFGASTLFTFTSIENVDTDGGADVIGNGSDNLITIDSSGSQDDNDVSGGGGNDTIATGDGFDDISGGSGDDVILLEDDLDDTTVDGDGGTDTLDLSGSGGGWSIDAMGNADANANNTTIEFDGIEELVGSDFADTVAKGDLENVDLLDGNDTLTASNDGSSATLSGGDGTDTLDLSGASAGFTFDNSSMATSGGTSFSTGSFEELIGTNFADNVSEGSLNTLDLGLGNDTLTMDVNGADDNIRGGGGIDRLINPGNAATIDLLNGTFDGATISGFEQVEGSDTGNDLLIGSGGNNTLEGRGGADTILGNAGNDRIDGGVTNADDSLVGGGGDDWMTVTQGDDTVIGQGGDDSLISGVGADSVVGGAGADTMRAQGGDDQVLGQGQDDSMTGGSGNDFMAGGAGNDIILGQGQNDTILGQNGDDTIRGGVGNDEINGGSGADDIRGQGGNDEINGFLGQDTMLGGAGDDVFVFSNILHSNIGAEDLIQQWDIGNNTIDLSTIDANTTAGGNQAFTFVGLGGHTGAGGTLRYEQSGGSTWVYGDTNGDGADDFGIQIAGTHTLAGSDFVL